MSNSEEDLKIFEGVGRQVEEFKFYHTSEEAGKEAFPELTKFPAVVVLRDFDEQKLIFADELKVETLQAFLRKYQLPLVAVLDKEIVTILFQHGTKKGVLLIYTPGLEGNAKAEFTKFAEANKSPDYLFVLVSSQDGDWGKRLIPYFGLDEKDLPVVEVLALSNSEPQRFRHKGKIVLDEMNIFLSEYKAGKIEKFSKSEPIPATNPGPVFKAVGKNFKAEVLDNDMDVLVKFYAEWCGHCKHLAPVYVAAAENLKHNKKLKLVEMDATKNDVEGVHIQSFPTIKFYKAGQKDKPIDFSGERTEEGIAKFLKENCATPITGKKPDL